MKKQVKNNVSWVGKVDWELESFHGEELSTHKGSTYNSYLIQEEKTVLIDTVWAPFAEEFVENLAKEVDLKKIDYIIANHGEVDHSGALPALMKHIPDTPIYCTANAVKSLKGQYHEDWNFKVVKTGDSIDIGNGKSLVFVEMAMLHWPDSMATYLTEDNILFSNDAFGQHYATEKLYNDLVDEGDLFNDYIHDMRIMQDYADTNRRTIAKIIMKNMKLHPIHEIMTRHNYIDIDNMILRKGSISAQKDEEVIIPMNMRDGSLICKGKGNPDWNYSAPHGAGRLMSRTEAKESISMNDYKKSMNGIYSSCISKETIDESAFAYKPMQSIIDNIKDTVEIIDIIKPIYNFKAED